MTSDAGSVGPPNSLRHSESYDHVTIGGGVPKSPRQKVTASTGAAVRNWLHRRWSVPGSAHRGESVAMPRASRYEGHHRDNCPLAACCGSGLRGRWRCLPGIAPRPVGWSAGWSRRSIGCVVGSEVVLPERASQDVAASPRLERCNRTGGTPGGPIWGNNFEKLTPSDVAPVWDAVIKSDGSKVRSTRKKTWNVTRFARSELSHPPEVRIDSPGSGGWSGRRFGPWFRRVSDSPSVRPAFVLRSSPSRRDRPVP